MPRPPIEEIIASLEEKSLLDLKALTDLLLHQIAGAETEEERKQRERFEEWKTPWYSLYIVGLKVSEGKEKALLVKPLREILQCSLTEAFSIMKSFPYEVASTYGEYPLTSQKKFRPLMEALENLGFIMEEKYHFGQYA